MLNKKYNAKECEKKWLDYWKEKNIYKFELDNRKIFSIDTPPPTVSGEIHIGHIYSYMQTEMIARYKRLMGFNVFYPFGFDDNGLPTERLVEKVYGKTAREIGKEEFLKLCKSITEEYEEKFRNLFNSMGVSTDWNLMYKTINYKTAKISQASFLDLVNKKHCYRSESPALWCNECKTIFAQAELETKFMKIDEYSIKFKTIEDNEEFTIKIIRPELLAASVAIFINPKNDKFKHLIGKNTIIPLYNIEIPILASDKVDLEENMILCTTFSNARDIELWRINHLPLRNILNENGKIKENIDIISNLSINKAREKIVEKLNENNYILKIEKVEKEIQIHERCGKPIEYSVMKQWFLDTTTYKDKFLKIGNQIKWYPETMHNKYNEWIKNVAWDWCISRQRYFGIPLPVWYCKKCGKTIYANVEDLPVNPLIDNPNIDKCTNCGCSEFIPDLDVMDTWATSSLTPIINLYQDKEKKYYENIDIYSLRTNASDIIRTWDFYTIVKNYYHLNKKPWENVVISGFVMANKNEKLSKSKNNAKSNPAKILEQYSADIFRYWTATGRLGKDILYNEETLIRGKKLINKLWNVSKFVEMHLEDYEDKEFNDFEYMDRYILAEYQNMEEKFIKYMDSYEVGLGMKTLEKFFWNFCDNYIEIVKHRLYRPEEFGKKARYSGQKTVYIILYKLLQQFSIFLPFITEEIYQTIYKFNKSIHLTEIKKLSNNYDFELENGRKIIDIIKEIRGIKTNNNVSLKTEILNLVLEANYSLKEAIEKAKLDIKATLFINNFEFTECYENFNIKKIELKN